MDGDGFQETGWCHNIIHPDHLHRLTQECVLSVTLEERMEQIKAVIRETGKMEELSDHIRALRDEAADRVFWGVVGYNYPRRAPKKE